MPSYSGTLPENVAPAPSPTMETAERGNPMFLGFVTLRSVAAPSLEKNDENVGQALPTNS